MRPHVLILGAGFAGLELATRAVGDGPGQVDVTLLDRNDSFYFGFSKLEVMVGRESADAVRLPYADIAADGVTFLRLGHLLRRVRRRAGQQGGGQLPRG